MNRKALNEVQIVLEAALLVLLFVPRMYMWYAEGAGYDSHSAQSFIQVMKNLNSVWMIIFLVLEVIAFGFYLVNMLFDIGIHGTIYMVVFPVVRLTLFGVGSVWLAVGMVRTYLYQGMERMNTCGLQPLFYVVAVLLALITLAEFMKVFSESDR